MSQSHNLEILNSIYQNCKMSSESIKQVVQRCEDPQFRSYLIKQRERYEQNCAKVDKQIQLLGGESQKPPLSLTLMAQTGIEMKTMTDTSRQNIAKLMFTGTNRGILDMQRVINRATDADKSVVDESRSLIETEQRYVNELKGYL